MHIDKIFNIIYLHNLNEVVQLLWKIKNKQEYFKYFNFTNQTK